MLPLDALQAKQLATLLDLLQRLHPLAQTLGQSVRLSKLMENVFDSRSGEVSPLESKAFGVI